MHALIVVISFLYVLAGSVLGADILNITASTCVNPGDFATCFDALSQHEFECTAQAGSDASSILACGCTALVTEIECALTNCWNVVYGCEYQSVANQIVAQCFGSDIPFFPAPENAPGGCDCNLGDVYYNELAVYTAEGTCVQQANQPLNIPLQQACYCCFAAGQYTAKFSICPNTDPGHTGYYDDIGGLERLIPDYGECGQYFDQYPCVQSLGYPTISSFSYLTALPASTGTASLSTTAGGGTITAPLSGDSFLFTVTWTAGVGGSISTTIVAAAVASSSVTSSSPTTADSSVGPSSVTSSSPTMVESSAGLTPTESSVSSSPQPTTPTSSTDTSATSSESVPPAATSESAAMAIGRGPLGPVALMAAIWATM